MRDPAETVRAALAAAAVRDTDALVALCAADCTLRVPEGTLRGHAGVRALLGEGGGKQPSMACGEPEYVGAGHVIVPLTTQVEVGERTVDVHATAIWTVEHGQVKAMRGVAGERGNALRELGLR